MIFVADIGNTRTHFGLSHMGKIRNAVSVKTVDIFKREFLLKMTKSLLGTEKDIDGVFFASVVPGINNHFIATIKNYTGIIPLELGKDIPVPIRIKVLHPQKVGQDRLANCVAAYEMVKSACVVVDIGTAITIDVVSQEGDFIGGMIAPGIDISIKTLENNCALLPHIVFKKPKKFIGKDTKSCIMAGVYLQIVGLIKMATNEIRREMPNHTQLYKKAGYPTTPSPTHPTLQVMSGTRLGAIGCPATKKLYVIGTGGGLNFFEKTGIFDEIRPHLTLEGIVLSARKYKGQ